MPRTRRVRRDTTRRSSFGSVRQLPSGRWRPQYRKDAREHPVTPGVTYATEQEAWDAIDDYLTDQRRGVNRQRPNEEPLADYMHRWFEVHKGRLAPSSVADYESVIKHGVLRAGTALDRVQLVDVDYLLVQRWVNDMADKWSDTRRRKGLRIFSRAMADAKRARLIPDNPCDGVTVRPTPTSKPTRQHYYMYVSEVARLVAAAEYIPNRDHEDWGCFFEVAAWSGMRPQEVRALWPEQVHERGCFILVDAGISEGANKASMLRKSTKNGLERMAYLPRPVMDRLVARIADHGIGPQQLVFPGEDGEYMWSSTYNSQGWVPMCGVAGIEPDMGSLLRGRRQTAIPYDLRAAIISHLRSAGVPQIDVGAQVGHQDEAVTAMYTVVAAAGQEDQIAVRARQETDQTRAHVLDYLYAEAQKTLG